MNTKMVTSALEHTNRIPNINLVIALLPQNSILIIPLISRLGVQPPYLNSGASSHQVRIISPVSDWSQKHLAADVTVQNFPRLPFLSE